MDRRRNKRILVGGWAVVAILSCGVSLVSGWGGSGGSWSSDSGSRSGYSWSDESGSDTSSGVRLTFDDCAKCHTSLDNITRHHDLITTAGKKCTDCHQLTAGSSDNFTVQVVRECQVCHGISVHDTVQHRVDSCGGCHGSNLVDVHSGWRSSSSSPAAGCYLCHTSNNTKVRQTIAKGISGETVSCTDCHGSNPHSWGGDGSWGR